MTNIVELAKSVVDGLRAMKKELDGIEGILNSNGKAEIASMDGPTMKQLLKNAKKKGKRKYTKRANYWKNPVKKHAKV